ncbi:hypothetical protein BDV23DRAFT_55281 [Aspergillus alliaceus]|uniref:Uncharacterized protein n=1 Tax=Petromyces alliaceus TaxID=209559 RepID=A0A5N7CE35_PETAA|nr:hypothetical protein BDV23DRAFT_55281 [Aspergillus alliaceus]
MTSMGAKWKRNIMACQSGNLGFKASAIPPVPLFRITVTHIKLSVAASFVPAPFLFFLYLIR